MFEIYIKSTLSVTNDESNILGKESSEVEIVWKELRQDILLGFILFLWNLGLQCLPYNIQKQQQQGTFWIPRNIKLFSWLKVCKQSTAFFDVDCV